MGVQTPHTLCCARRLCPGPHAALAGISCQVHAPPPHFSPGRVTSAVMLPNLRTTSLRSCCGSTSGRQPRFPGQSPEELQRGRTHHLARTRRGQVSRSTTPPLSPTCGGRGGAGAGPRPTSPPAPPWAKPPMLGTLCPLPRNQAEGLMAMNTCLYLAHWTHVSPRPQQVSPGAVGLQEKPAFLGREDQPRTGTQKDVHRDNHCLSCLVRCVSMAGR